ATRRDEFHRVSLRLSHAARAAQPVSEGHRAAEPGGGAGAAPDAPPPDAGGRLLASNRDPSDVTLFWDSPLVVTASVKAIHCPRILWQPGQRVLLASPHNGPRFPSSVVDLHGRKVGRSAVRRFSLIRPADRIRVLSS